MPPPTVIDPDAIANLRSLSPDGGDEFLIEIIGIFTADTPERLAELDASLAGGEAERFVRAAHSIKGSAANLGALRLRAAAEQLEHHARQTGLGGTRELIAGVKAEYAQAAAALATLLPPRS